MTQVRWPNLIVCLVFVGLIAGILSSCSTIQKMLPAQRQAKRYAEQLQELQLNVMRFADEYKTRVSEAAGRFQASAQKPEDRLSAQNWKLQQSEAVYLIASGPNPLTNALDVVVLATLSSMVLDDTALNETYGDRTAFLKETHQQLEQQAWQLVSGVLTESQGEQLRDVITRWRAQHPKVYSVGGIHFSEFAKSVGAPGPGEDKKLGSIFSLLGIDPFSSLDPAIREITQTRQLAERSIFYLQRAPDLLSMQAQRFTDLMATLPETKAMLASIDRVSLVGSASDRLANILPDIIAKEREALLSQLTRELANQRGAISAISDDLRSTLQAGTETVTALHAMLDSADKLSARFANPDAATKSTPEENARPFDIREYSDTLRELTVSIRELNSLTNNLDKAVPLVRTATQDAVVQADQFLNRAYWKLLSLIAFAIVGSLAAAVGYRLIVARIPKSPAS